MILTLALCCVREHRDEKEAQQAETQSDCEPHPDTSRPKDTIHLIGKAVQEEKADNRVEKRGSKKRNERAGKDGSGREIRRQQKRSQTTQRG